MRNVDEAIKILEDSIPGLTVKNYKVVNGTFSMDLFVGERCVPCAGHVVALEEN